MVGVSAGEEQSPILTVAWEGWTLYRFSLWALSGGGVETGEMDMGNYPTFGEEAVTIIQGYGMNWTFHALSHAVPSV